MNLTQEFESAIRKLTGNTGSINREDLLKEDLGLDSLSLVCLIVDFEEALGILFDEGDLSPDALITAGDMLDLLEKYV